MGTKDFEKTPSQFNNEFMLKGKSDVLLSHKVFDCTKGCRLAIEVIGYDQAKNKAITTDAQFGVKTNFEMIQLFSTHEEKKGINWEYVAIGVLSSAVVVLGYKLKNKQQNEQQVYMNV